MELLQFLSLSARGRRRGGLKFPTMEEYTRRATNEAKLRGHQLLSVVKITQARLSVVTAVCEIGHTYTAQLFLFLKGLGVCKVCSSAAPRHYRRLEPDFSKSGLAEGTVVERHLDTRYCSVVCPLCSNDEYVRAGLCSGVFVCNIGSTKAGFKTCRCSKNYRWTQEQREYYLRKILTAKGLGVTFVAWESGYSGAHSKAVLSCPDHGNFIINNSRIPLTKNGCPKCKRGKGGFKKELAAFVYVLIASDGKSRFAGYGITNGIQQRKYTHTRELLKKGFEVEEWKVYEVCGVLAFEIERKIMTRFERNSQDITGFRTEATQWYNYEEVLDFVESLIEQGEDQ